MKKLLKVLFGIILALALVIAVALGVFTVAEYRPAETETVTADHETEAVLETGKTLTLVSWNCGYGALGDNADFFMDGGSSVYTADRDRVQQNLAGIRDTLKGMDPDLVILQEVDINSSRSYGTDERAVLRDVLPGASEAFAYTSTPCMCRIPFRPSGMWRAACLPSAGRRPGRRSVFRCRSRSPGRSAW